MAQNDNAHDQPTDRPAGDEAPGAPPPNDEASTRSSRAEAAFEAVRRAEGELERARALYEHVRREAAEQLDKVRAKRIGDVLDDVTTLVRKFPGTSLVVAGLVGYYLGRLLRR